MSAASSDQAILDYIRANRGAFGRAAIDRELLAAGHAPEAIAAAWAAIEAAEAPFTPPFTPEKPAEPATPPEPVALAVAATEPPSEPAPPADAPAPDRERDPAIARYITENRGVYNRAAITTSLIASGHAPDDIEATWGEILAADAPPPPADTPPSSRRAVLNSWRFWLTATLVIVAQIALPIGLTAAFPDQPIGAGVGFALLIGFVGVGLIMLALRRARDVAWGLIAGVLALIALGLALALLAFILLVIILGICLVAFGRSGLSP